MIKASDRQEIRIPSRILLRLLVLSLAAVPSYAQGPVPRIGGSPPGRLPGTTARREFSLGLERFRPWVPIPFIQRGSADTAPAPPGMPPRWGRPRPGSVFDPGASGPGISQSADKPFLDGAFDPRTGWPYVLLDHFRPRPERVEGLWMVETRDVPQEMGTDPWASLKVLHFDEGGSLVERDPRELLALVANRPVMVQVQGSLTSPDIALGGLLWTHSWLTYNKAITPDVVVIAFDWPSQRVHRLDVRDINEKGRRAYVAAYHLARFVQAFPPRSRICLLGQSYGGRVVTSALHLLGGGRLNSQSNDPPVSLPSLRPDLSLRAVVIAGAADRHWLDPGERLDRTLVACEAFLNLYNRRDEALKLYPFLIRSGHHRALGRVGLRASDLRRLGPTAARYTEHDMHDLLGREHTLLDAVSNPQIARWIAPYLWNDNPEPSPPQTPTKPLDIEGHRGRTGAQRTQGQSLVR